MNEPAAKERGQAKMLFSACEFPVFEGESWEDHLSIWTELEQAENYVQLRKGAVLASLETKHGEHSLEGFAYDVRIAYSTARAYRNVYRRLERLQIDSRESILRMLEGGTLLYSHVRTAAAVEDDEVFVELLTRAHDSEERWTVKRLAEEVATARGLKPAPGPLDVEPETLPQKNGLAKWYADLKERAPADVAQSCLRHRPGEVEEHIERANFLAGWFQCYAAELEALREEGEG